MRMPRSLVDRIRRSTGRPRRAVPGAGPVLATLLAAASLAAGATALPTTAAGATTPPTVPPVHLPADEAPHHGPVEWWYFNGHLTATGPAGHVRAYGYELVTFQLVGLTPSPLYVANFAITDLGRHEFHFGVRQGAHGVPAEHGAFSLATGGWTMAGNGTTDTLSAELPGYALQLHLHSLEPPSLYGRDGVVDLGPLGVSDYYSFTDLATTGTLVDHGVRLAVTGTSWMDHEWNITDLFSGAGWDWFSVQLSNGTQYMCYFLRDRAGRIVASLGAKVGGSGATGLAATSLGEQVLGHWRSPTTGITYSSGWVLTLPGGHLTVRPDLLDQEVAVAHQQGPVYWEGDVTVSGVLDGRPVHGVGYTELNPPGQRL